MQFSGSMSNGGIRGMAQSLSAMAGELDGLCNSHNKSEMVN